MDFRLTLNGFLLATLLFFISPTVYSEGIDTDLKGSQDHPSFPRITDSVIIGHAHSDYGLAEFVSSWEKNRKPTLIETEGKRTRIAYIAPENVSTIQILRSYQQAFNEIGEVQTLYECRKERYCKRLRPNKETQVDISTVPDYLTGVFYMRNDNTPIYWYGTINNAQSQFHVALFTALQNNGDHNLKRFHDRPFIWLEIIEISDFKPTLEFVTSDEMTKAIDENGRVALYGIHFEFDSDQLKTESNRTLEEIAKTLSADLSLSLYVVGHTDNQGTFDYNHSLAKRRAKSVVEALVTDYKIDRKRLLPIGVGPVSPVASNTIENGRALNRRVELVPR